MSFHSELSPHVRDEIAHPLLKWQEVVAVMARDNNDDDLNRTLTPSCPSAL